MRPSRGHQNRFQSYTSPSSLDLTGIADDRCWQKCRGRLLGTCAGLLGDQSRKVPTTSTGRVTLPVQLAKGTRSIVASSPDPCGETPFLEVANLRLLVEVPREPAGTGVPAKVAKD